MPLKKVFIKYVNIVGMRHHSDDSELPVNTPFVLKLEPDNQYDSRAVRVVNRSDNKTMAYLSRASRSLIAPLLEYHVVSGNLFLNPKMPAKVHYNKITQKCALGFYAQEQYIERIMDMYKNTGLSVTVS